MNLKTDNRYYTALTAYLLGLDMEKYDISFIDHMEIPVELENNKEALILRNLCILRNNFLNSYDSLSSFFSTTLRNIIDSPSVDQSCVKYLKSVGIDLRITNARASDYIRSISDIINDYAKRISNSDLLPEWASSVLRECYCGIFTVQKRVSGVTLAKTYSRLRKKYPYQLFVGFDLSTYSHNLLYRDSMLFSNIQTLAGVKDVVSYDRLLVATSQDLDPDNEAEGTFTLTREDTKNALSDFLGNSSKILIIVDCENTHVDTVVAVINDVSRSNIKGNKYKIVLVDDEKCHEDWEIVKLFTNFEVEHIEMHRLKSQKSTVDMRLALIVQREVLKNGIDRVGNEYLNRLEEWGIGCIPSSYLDVSDFAAEKSKLYKSWILNCLNENYSFNVSKILELVSKNISISDGDKESLTKMISDKLTLVSKSNGDISFVFK